MDGQRPRVFNNHQRRLSTNKRRKEGDSEIELLVPVVDTGSISLPVSLFLGTKSRRGDHVDN